MASITDSVESIRAAFERMDAMFNHADCGLASFTPEGILTGANELTLRWLERSYPEAIGSLTIERFTASEQLRQGVRRGLAVNVEAPLLRKNGGSVEVLASCAPVRDAHGHHAMNRLWLHDLSERRRTEERLRASEGNMARAQALTHFGHYEAHLEHSAESADLAWSEEFFRIVELDPKQGPLSTEEFAARRVHPEDREMFFRFFDECVAHMRGGALEYRIVTPEAGVRHLRDVVQFVPHRDGRAARFFGVVQDVTELRTAQQQLRELAAHLLDVREEERTHLARELHDELGSNLSAIKMFIGGALEQVPALQAQQFPLQRALQLLDHALASVRDITSNLRPSVLDYRGLRAALEWLAQTYGASSGVACEVRLDDAVLSALDAPAVRTAIFRIVQEALHNAVRHAQAARITIAARRVEAWLELEVQDDGVGIEPQDLGKPGCWGVTGMHERARALGAQLSVAPAVDKGTRVLLRMPLTPAD